MEKKMAEVLGIVAFWAVVLGGAFFMLDRWAFGE